jgi:hypothetical protein
MDWETGAMHYWCLRLRTKVHVIHKGCLILVHNRTKTVCLLTTVNLVCFASKSLDRLRILLER